MNNDLRPYLQHLGNCGAKGSNDPLDERCICGLRLMMSSTRGAVEPLDCRSEEGVTVSLVDALISIGRILSKRTLTESKHVREALKDFLLDADLGLILSVAETVFDEDAQSNE